MPSTDLIIKAAPFPLPQPRDFDAYELAIVKEAVVGGMAAVVLANSPNTKISDLVPEADALVQAIASSSCSLFKALRGPSPSVNVALFSCIGRGYGGTFTTPSTLSTAADRANVRASIQSGQICGTTGFFQPCADPNFMLSTYLPGVVKAVLESNGIDYKIDPPEGLPQFTTYASIPNNETAPIRSRTAYKYMTGQQIIALVQKMQASGVSLPPNVVALLNLASNPLAASFLTTPFLLGVAVNQNVDIVQTGLALLTVLKTGQPTQADLMRACDLLIDDVVAVFAPGKGFSLLPFIRGSAGLPEIISLIMAMGLGNPGMPGPVPAVIPQLPPDVIGQLGNALGGLLGALGGGQVQRSASGTKTRILTRGRLSGPREPSALLDVPFDQLIRTTIDTPPIPAGTTLTQIPVKDLPLTKELNLQTGNGGGGGGGGVTTPADSGSDNTGILLAVGGIVIVGGLLLLSGGSKKP